MSSYEATRAERELVGVEHCAALHCTAQDRGSARVLHNLRGTVSMREVAFGLQAAGCHLQTGPQSHLNNQKPGLLGKSPLDALRTEDTSGDTLHKCI